MIIRITAATTIPTIAPTERLFDSSVSSLTAVEFLSLLPVQKKVFIFHPMFCIFFTVVQ